MQSVISIMSNELRRRVSTLEKKKDISHNGNSGFGDNADSAETADLGRVLINA
jgi:hypothetical protein